MIWTETTDVTMAARGRAIAQNAIAGFLQPNIQAHLTARREVRLTQTTEIKEPV